MWWMRWGLVSCSPWWVQEEGEWGVVTVDAQEEGEDCVRVVSWRFVKCTPLYQG